MKTKSYALMIVFLISLFMVGSQGTYVTVIKEPVQIEKTGWKERFNERLKDWKRSQETQTEPTTTETTTTEPTTTETTTTETTATTEPTTTETTTTETTQTEPTTTQTEPVATETTQETNTTTEPVTEESTTTVNNEPETTMPVEETQTTSTEEQPVTAEAPTTTEEVTTTEPVEETAQTTESGTVLFGESFETIQTMEDLFDQSTTTHWTDMHKTYDQNTFEVYSEPVSSEISGISSTSSTETTNDTKSMLFFAQGTDDPSRVSKSSIICKAFDFKPGDEVKFSARFYIPSGQALKNVTLMDLECRDCWGEGNIYPNKSPGLRVQFINNEGVLKIDRGKIGYTEHFLPAPEFLVPVAKDRWVKLVLVVKLGLGDAGVTKFYIDDQEVINSTGTNVADPDLFKQHYIILKDEIRYDSIEIGVSANQQSTNVQVLVDDVELKLM